MELLLNTFQKDWVAAAVQRNYLKKNREESYKYTATKLALKDSTKNVENEKNENQIKIKIIQNKRLRQCFDILNLIWFCSSFVFGHFYLNSVWFYCISIYVLQHSRGIKINEIKDAPVEFWVLIH